MKNKYMQALQESLVDMGKMEKYSGTVGNILSYNGVGSQPTHKVAKSDVVSVLERMYKEEDEDTSFLKEASDEAGVEHKDQKDEVFGGEKPVELRKLIKFILIELRRN